MTGGAVPFDRVADSYDETRGGTERGREVAGVLVGLLPSGGPLLEVGVGTGVVAAALAELGRTVVGVDLSLPMLARAAARTPGRVLAGDARRLPVSTGAVAGAYLVHVLHVVGDVDATLAELVRVLRPGGTLAVTARPLPGPPSADVHRILDELQGRFGVAERPDREDLVVAAAARVGLHLVERRSTVRDYLRLTPRVVAERIEDRSWSWMWSVADRDAWRSAAGSVLAELRALPDQDRERPGAEATPVLAFRAGG